MKSFFIYLIISSFFLLGSCKKAKEDVLSPVVQVLSPLKDSQHAAADSLLIHVIVEDEDLHDYRITIRYYVGTELCCTNFDFKKHTHEKVAEYKRMLAPQATGTYNIAVEAADHNGNTTKVDHDFEVI
jgi:hypothetical protein